MSDHTEELKGDVYLRERYDPRPEDLYYLHLSDLRLALEPFRTNEKVTVIDYGCGGSPYHPLFPNATYLRADFGEAKNLDFNIKDGLLPDAANECCDIVLSTQVLEHVEEPSAYIGECFRLLKPGGQLILSTHGMFQEHGCPSDFQRWTVPGLRKILERSGFVVDEIYRLTNGPRAVLFLLDLNYPSLSVSRKTIYGFSIMVFRYFYRRYQVFLRKQADRFYHQFRIGREKDESYHTFVCMLASCRKPIQL